MAKSQSVNLQVGVHQVPKSFSKLLLLAFQHVFAMFGANILVPILVNNAAGQEVIPIQVAFLCSGLGTVLYLLITGFKTPIYLGSSFAFLGGMTALYGTTGFNVFASLMIVGFIYVILAMIIYFTKSAKSIKKVLSPVVVGPAIMMIGWSLISNAAKDSLLNPYGAMGSLISNPDSISSPELGNLWSVIAISVSTFAIIVIAMIFLKGIWKMIPLLLGIVGGVIVSVIVWSIAKGTGNDVLANFLYGTDKAAVQTLLDPSSWKWYPDITTMWSTNVVWDFKAEAYLAIVPLVIVTLAEHIGDHVNIGHITGEDYISKKPGLYRTLIGDGVATIVSASMGGPANTSYGENTSVISVTRVASVWVIFTAAIISMCFSFIAPISIALSTIPSPVLGGIGILLYSMIAINGLKIMINAKLDMFKAKNIVIVAVMAVTGLGGTMLVFLPSDVLNNTQIALSGTGVGVIIAVLLNWLLPDKEKSDSKEKLIESIDFSPTDFMQVTNLSKIIKKPAQPEEKQKSSSTTKASTTKKKSTPKKATAKKQTVVKTGASNKTTKVKTNPTSKKTKK
ncbi:MAG: uracil-xanthine permease family protein [Mycoplasma sp.]